MREIERIDRICNLLKEKWKKAPDERLGQFLINHIYGPDIHKDIRIYYIEDDKVEFNLKNLFSDVKTEPK
ncbi:MAG: hypothetical protein ACFFCV_11640 [Promethearchaeota archaeon]